MVSATVHLASPHVTLGPSAQDLAFLLAASTPYPSDNTMNDSQPPSPGAPAALPLVLSDRFDSLLDPPPVLVLGHVRLTGVTKKTSTTSNITVVQVALVGVERESHPANPGVRKELVNERVVLWSKDGGADGGGGGSARRLADGCHEFPFSIPLPADVPPTLKVQYGQVAYKLVVTLHRAVLFPLKFTHPLIVRRCVPTIRRSISAPDHTTTATKPSEEEEDNHRTRLSSTRYRPLSPPPSPSLHPSRNNDNNDYYHNHFLFAPHLQRESFTGPTASSEFTYTVTLPRAILRNNNNNNNNGVARNNANTHIIMLHLAPNTQPLSTIRALECTIVERRSFRSSIAPSRELPTLAPTVEEEVLTRPAVRYKLALPSPHDDEDEEDESGGGNEEAKDEEEEEAEALACGRSMPFVMSIGDDTTTVDVSTPTLAISHVVRIVVEYEPAGVGAPAGLTACLDRPRSPTTAAATTTTNATTSSYNSMWRTTRGRGSGDAKKTRVTIEVPIYIADALDDEEDEEDSDNDAARWSESRRGSGDRRRLAVAAPARRPAAIGDVLPSPPPSP
ncbi:hypothetical protein HDU87_003071 [Geranomyces variabilis]|uniref:Arrestin-like N-terminal domain-containing protein n=1 Tax=Geranomyces variabilis TaxID=109894 RepID=A0AAD5XRL6_9FUNG|nr:hypothetical protein HDU87_003071 [Geranomyces variabilis]